MKHLLVAGLSILILSGCFEQEKRYRGDYPTSFVDAHPSIDIYAEFRKPLYGNTIDGNTRFHFEWVRF
ncbi:MAG TPA: hypothetical protein VJL87_05040, partial [Bdellovibrionota bacterium]|nr:hypothetical protein [Bdellovibrionota bacterium]